jgi:hypothetical protein
MFAHWTLPSVIRDAAPKQAFAVAAGEINASPIPACVREYNRLTETVKSLNERLNGLKPNVKAYIESLPSKSCDFGSGKICVTSKPGLATITQAFLRRCIVDLMQQHDAKQSQEERAQFAYTMTNYVWQQRRFMGPPRLGRTWSRPNKRKYVDAIVEPERRS